MRHWTQRILNKPHQRTQLPTTTAADGHDVVGRASIDVMMLLDDTLPLRPMSFMQSSATTAKLCNIGQAPIGMLTDDSLLGIFGFYVHETQGTNRWMALVHVCQRWRNIILGSPRGLNLQLVCTARTPARRKLDVWPPLPIVIKQYVDWTLDISNILAALKHNDRIREIKLTYIPSAQLEEVLPAMQEPFPALTRLEIHSAGTGETQLPVLGSAPRLRVLVLRCNPFRGLPNLLFSATNLAVLFLHSVPHSGYISPETIVTCLSRLTGLKKLWLGFESPRPGLDRERRRPPQPTRSILPALAYFVSKGDSEYLEDLVSGIDAPQLGKLAITFFHQLIFDTPQLTRFISRIPTLRARDQAKARLVFSEQHICVIFPRTLRGVFRIGISCIQSDWQLSALAQLCASSFPQILIPTVEHLYIVENTYFRPHWRDDIENSQWLEILRPFTGVKDLYLSKELVPHIARPLQELVRGRVTESLPTLQRLLLEKGYQKSQPIEKAIGKFVGARLLSNRPMSISHWRRGRSSWSFDIPDVYSASVFFKE
jgi:hypothetical protein